MPGTAVQKLVKIDILGLVLAVASMTCLCLCLQWGGITKKWSDAHVIGVLVGAILLFAAFVASEVWSTECSFVSVRLLKSNRTVALNFTFITIYAGLWYVQGYYFPLYFQAVYGISASRSGVWHLAYVSMNSVFPIVAAAILSRTGRYTPLLLLGSATSVIGAAVIAAEWGGSTTRLAVVIGLQIIAGTGAGLVVQIPNTTSLLVVSRKDIIRTSALMAYGRSMGGALALPIAQSLFLNAVLRRLPPGIDPRGVIRTGATDITKVFGYDQAEMIRAAYVVGFTRVFYLTSAIGAAATVVAAAAGLCDRESLKHRSV